MLSWRPFVTRNRRRGADSPSYSQPSYSTVIAAATFFWTGGVQSQSSKPRLSDAAVSNIPKNSVSRNVVTLSIVANLRYKLSQKERVVKEILHPAKKKFCIPNIFVKCFGAWRHS